MPIPMTDPSVQVIRPVCRDSPPRLELCLYCVCSFTAVNALLQHDCNKTRFFKCVVLSQVLYTATTLTEYHMWGSLMLAPRYTSYWGEHELAPPVELNVPPVYICTYVPVPGRPCTNVKYIHQDQIYDVNIPYIFSKSGTHGWLTDALPYSLRGNGDLEKLRETGRESVVPVCQDNLPGFLRREAHLPTATQQQRLASEIDKFDFRKPATLLKL